LYRPHRSQRLRKPCGRELRQAALALGSAFCCLPRRAGSGSPLPSRRTLTAPIHGLRSLGFACAPASQPALVKYAVSTVGDNPVPPQLERGGGGDGRCDAEEPTGRYAAYTERTIRVEKGLAIALGDEAACRRLRMRIIFNRPTVRREGTG
jgi:hypothetical protein